MCLNETCSSSGVNERICRVDRAEARRAWNNIYKKIKLTAGEKDDPAKEKGRICELEMKGRVSQEQEGTKSAECSETGRRLEMPAALGDEEDFGDLGGAGGVRECRHCIELVF